MSSKFDWRTWPPELSKELLEDLTVHAASFSLSQGLSYLPEAVRQPAVPMAAIHAPFALLPSPFPRQLFEKAKRIQRSYNILYARIAMDENFLDRVMGGEQGIGKVDTFIGQLWHGWKQLRDVGLAQPLHLGLFRSDYMLHSQTGEDLGIKQVEFNTISVSFGGLAEKITALHRYLHSATEFYNSSPFLNPANFPDNQNISGLATGLAEAHRAYGVASSRILFVVQPGERNIFDQRALEYELLEKHSIKSIRRTFDELGRFASVDPTTSILKVACPIGIDPSGYIEISTVYYRAGYAPQEYATSQDFNTRFLMERSKAIKCPTIPLQLAGGKKVQQVLTQPGVLEYFLGDKTEEEIAELRGSFMEMWGLDVGEDATSTDIEAIKSGKENFGIQKARESALSLVLKPQREGGGNNIYKADIPAFLDGLAPIEREAWIAMRLIQPPDSGNYLVRAGSANLGNQLPIKSATVSELGIFGWALFGGPARKITEREVGWLLRTKGKESNEGGVATGFSVLDSLLLV